jgi:hypothetical protein
VRDVRATSIAAIAVFAVLAMWMPRAASAALFARLDPAGVEHRISGEPGLIAAQGARPDARLVVRFDPESRTWSAALRQRGAILDLARYVIDDRSGRIVSRYVLPPAMYPSRLQPLRATTIAKHDRDARARARAWGGIGGLRSVATKHGCCWEVVFRRPLRDAGRDDAPVLQVDVDDSTARVVGVWSGVQIPWKMARGDREAFGGDINRPYTWYALFVIFALVAIDWRRVRSWWTADVLALLLMGVSLECFQHAAIDWSVPLAVPPLAWLCLRSWWVFHHGLPPQRPAHAPRAAWARFAMRRVPTVAIVVLCVFLAGIRIGVTLQGGNVIDVGYAGVLGARDELRGVAPWGHMPEDNQHGDTYGPLNYVAYLPATKLIGEENTDEFGNGMTSAAQWTSIAADLVCAALLALIAWRWISRRGAALAAAAWLACPWTTWALASGVNDALVALPLLAAFAVLPRATLRGFVVGAAAMVKFAPLAALAPLLHVGAARRVRQVVLAGVGALAAIGTGLAWVAFRIDGDSIVDRLRVFEERTLLFQFDRGSPFSPWGLYHWTTAQHVAQVVVVLVLCIAVVAPRTRSAWQVAAGISAALISVQLVVTHWFYLYIPWFVGFTILLLVAARERPEPLAAPAPDPQREPIT